MALFSKKTWKNRMSEYPTRRKLTKENGTTELVTVARSEGNVSQEGDAFSADNMNDLETRIQKAIGAGDIPAALGKDIVSALTALNTGLTNMQIIKAYTVVPQSTPYLGAFGCSIKRNGSIIIIKVSGLCENPPAWSSTVVGQVQDWNINKEIGIYTKSMYGSECGPVITISASGIIYMGGGDINHEFYFYGETILFV